MLDMTPFSKSQVDKNQTVQSWWYFNMRVFFYWAVYKSGLWEVQSLGTWSIVHLIHLICILITYIDTFFKISSLGSSVSELWQIWGRKWNVLRWVQQVRAKLKIIWMFTILLCLLESLFFIWTWGCEDLFSIWLILYGMFCIHPSANTVLH